MNRKSMCSLLILSLAAGTVAASPGGASAQSEPVLIRAGTIHTVTSGTIQDGEILIRDGVIEAVGTSVDAPAGVRVYEAEVVIPGMIDAHAHLALDRSGQARIPGPVTAEWKAVEHLDLEDPMIQVALSGGVTSLITRSGSGIISSGQSVALKMKSTPGPEMIFKPYVDLKMAVRPLINLRPGETPQTVMGWYATADDYFRRAQAYVEQQDAHAAGEGPAPERDERLEAFAAVIRGEVMVHAHSHYPSEVMMVLRLARKYGFFDRLALAHAEEIFPLTELLAGTKIVPVIGPMMIVQYYNDPEPLNLLEDLLDAGVHASIQTDMSNQHFKDFREYGAFLARHGLTDQQALEVMTINGARAMMLEDRVGSIEAGKDADLVLLDGHFLDLAADRVERVFVDGELEYERGPALQPERPRSVGPFTPVTGAIAPDDEVFAITGAHVFTISDGTVEDATLVVEDGGFTRVEAGASPPAGIPVMDVGGRVVMPGTVIGRAFANDWIGDLKWQVQNDEITAPVVPEMNALYGVDPWFPSYRVNTTIGVTAIHVTPGTRNLVGGNGVVVKTPGLDFEEMVRREPASMVFALTAAALREWTGESGVPLTLESASAMIRETLDAARDYDDAGEAREYDPRLEALLPLLRREVPALIHADQGGRDRGGDGHRGRLRSAAGHHRRGGGAPDGGSARGGRRGRHPGQLRELCLGHPRRGRGLERRRARHPEPSGGEGGVLRSGGLAPGLAHRAPRGRARPQLRVGLPQRRARGGCAQDGDAERRRAARHGRQDWEHRGGQGRRLRHSGRASLRLSSRAGLGVRGRQAGGGRGAVAALAWRLMDAAFDLVDATMDEVWSVDHADVVMARDLSALHPGLEARDLVHLACCLRRKARELMTFDRGLGSCVAKPLVNA